MIKERPMGLRKHHRTSRIPSLVCRTMFAMVRLVGIQTVAYDSMAQVRKKVIEYNMQVRAYNERLKIV